MASPSSAEIQDALRAVALQQVAAGKMGFKQDEHGVPIPGVLPDQFETVIKVFADAIATVWLSWQARTVVTGTANGVTTGVSAAPITGTLT